MRTIIPFIAALSAYTQLAGHAQAASLDAGARLLKRFVSGVMP